MWKQANLRIGEAALRLADMVAVLCALPVAARALLPLPPWGATALEAARDFPIELALLLWIASAWFHQVYESRPRATAHQVIRIARSMAVVALALLAGAVFHPPLRANLGLLVAWLAVAFVFLVANRAAARLAVRFTRRPGSATRRYAVVGSAPEGPGVVEAIAGHPEWDAEFVGFVRLSAGGRFSGARELGELADLGRILEDEVLDEVIFAVPREQLEAIEPAIATCQELGVEVRVSLDMLRFASSSMRLSLVNDLPMVVLSRTPTDSLALATKRLFDVLVSGAIILLALPALLLAAIAIRLDSPGPVFFRQRRVGRNGRTFDILKLRSMHRDAETRLEALKAQNEMSGPVFKMRRDPRVTRVGHFLRRTSLDEFPQFWNVLVGDMSIVGPRPPLPSEVRQYQPWQRRRLSVSPGITCIWQISGRNEVDFEQWMRLDLEYIDTWSLRKDLLIFLRTIPAVLGSRGAS